jgi:hypothetical protein
MFFRNAGNDLSRLRGELAANLGHETGEMLDNFWRGGGGTKAENGKGGINGR